MRTELEACRIRLYRDCVKRPISSCKLSGIAVVLALVILGIFSLGTPVDAQSAQNANSQFPSPHENAQMENSFPLMGSRAYRQEVSRLLLEQANKAASELSLPDNLPISEKNIAKLMIYPPRLAKNAQGLGSVITSNYTYSVSCGYKFSSVARSHLEQEDNQLKSKYALPMVQMDTNAALQLAIQFLAKASMDVAALNRDCKVQISTTICPDYEHFVPIYSVHWIKRRERFGNAASVEIFLPDKSLRQLHVNKSEYILSQPLQITDPDFLNMPTNPPSRQYGNFGLPRP